MALNMNQLAATTLPADDDIMHVRNTSGIDVKITWANLRKGITSYDEKSSAFTATESTENEGKLQVFKNTSGAAIVMTLGAGGPTLSIPAGSLVGVIYNGTDWSYATPLIDDGTAVLTGTSIVDTLQIAASAVETAKINDLAVTNAKIALLAVDTEQIAASAVETAKINNAAVTQAKLKTSTGSITNTYPSANNTAGFHLYSTLPGGQYGFWPQMSNNHTGGAASELIHLYVGYTGQDVSLASRVDFWVRSTSSNAVSGSCVATQRYVTSSGEVFWIFVLKEKATGLTVGMYEAPDHPCFGNGGDPETMPHPFGDYDLEDYEIIVVNPLLAQVEAIKVEAKAAGRQFIHHIFEDYDIADIATPLYPEADGKPGYFPDEVTVGLSDEMNWPFIPEGPVDIVKKVITRPAFVDVKKLVKKA